MLDALRQQARQSEGRDGESSASVIDSQNVEAADTAGRDTRGYDAGRKVSGRKRFIITDTLGLLITVTVCAASVPTATAPRTPCRACISPRPHAGSCSPTPGSPGGCWAGPPTRCAPR
ncbi:transposase [Actinomadura sp. SCN-SB]|uniref:transposase n=1 Tax=Actinomadura sp. SCN-SB TaxID=3373092 RepID=UPI00374FF649